MFGSNKPVEKTFHVVKLGYYPFYFTDEKEALEFYRTLSHSLSRVQLDSRMVDKGEDFSGYESLYYADSNPEISLSKETKLIYTKEEVDKKAAEIKAAKEKWEAKQPKPKKAKK